MVCSLLLVDGPLMGELLVFLAQCPGDIGPLNTRRGERAAPLVEDLRREWKSRLPRADRWFLLIPRAQLKGIGKLHFIVWQKVHTSVLILLFLFVYVLVCLWICFFGTHLFPCLSRPHLRFLLTYAAQFYISTQTFPTWWQQLISRSLMVLKIKGITPFFSS